MIGLSLRHHCPGRIRFSVIALKEFKGISQWLKNSLLSIQGIKDIRINEYACSVVVNYDPLLINPNLIETRLDSLNLNEGELVDTEHQYTRGDIAMNLIGTLAVALLPNRWGALVTTTLIAPTILNGVSDIKDKQITAEVLDALALGLSAWRGDYGATMLTQSLLSLGEYMEQSTCRRSDQLLADLMKPQESLVWRINADGSEQINSSLLVEGDLIEIGPGVIIPIDGHVESGTAFINQSSLTGESVPVRREKGALVYSGTTVHDGTIKVRVEKIGSESTTSKIAQLIYDSLSEKSEIQQVTQDMANRRVKITLGIGAAVYVLTQDLNRVASVFFVDYSCALKLSTPVAFKSIMYRAAQEGILLKGGSAIEKLVDVDTCIFDKTGTLTYGDMEVTDVVSLCDKNTAQELLAIAASVEEHSNHPLSQAIVNAAQNHQLPHIDHGEVEYVIAHGLRSSLNGHCLIMGSRHFLETDENVDFSPFEEKIREYEKHGRHLIFISRYHQLIGMIGLRDELRDDVHKTLQSLRDSGIKEIMMISGDNRYKAEMLGNDLQLDHVFSEATPESKADIIAKLQAQGKKVMFIGDGVNDAPALTKADVGIAMCKGTELAKQVADVTLLHDKLSSVTDARILAQVAMSLVNSNIKIAEYVNTGIMIAAAMGFLAPATSSLLHNGTTLAILGRSLAVKNKSVLL